jgi:hypothetical protein
VCTRCRGRSRALAGGKTEELAREQAYLTELYERLDALRR